MPASKVDRFNVDAHTMIQGDASTNWVIGGSGRSTFLVWFEEQKSKIFHHYFGRKVRN
jgi:hypothetical protein